MRSNRNSGYGLPPADTGVPLLDWLANASTLFVHLERRIDPFFRSVFDKLFREFLTNVTTALINMRRKDDRLKLAEERIQPDEEAHLAFRPSYASRPLFLLVPKVLPCGLGFSGK